MPLKVARAVPEESLRVPERWGMHSDKGNRRLAELAQQAYDKIEELCASGRPHGSAVRVVLMQYLVSWVRLWNIKTYGDAGDTVVRECVGDFHAKLWTAAGFGSEAPWEEHYDEAQLRGYCK